MSNKKIFSPLNGRAVTLDSVPDPVFSGRVLGDGCAVIPEDGKIYSPVDGKISTVAETLHAYGITSDDGVEILVHFGLETVSMKGEGFISHVKEGDRVTAGQLIAEADIELLKSRGIDLITPVLVCEGAEGLNVRIFEGDVKKGEQLILLGEVPENTSAEKKKPSVNFDFLQKLGKTLMTVIAVMPAAGLMISVGRLISMAAGDLNVISSIGSVVENIGWAIINNLHILFAAAIGGSWAKDRAGGAFAAVISFILINSIT